MPYPNKKQLFGASMGLLMLCGGATYGQDSTLRKTPLPVPDTTLGPDTRPRIGVTLSGGGAKGLAHIGILEAIDSAGLKVSAISGTSMGSIIGGLYAAGYSSDTLEKIARRIDWGSLLSNQSNLTNFKMEEKDEYGKYAFELPWINHSFRLPTGLLEGEELWLKFSELFFPVYATKDFRKMSIPFECIATDISTGNVVVLDSGEIVKAIRAGMAIPTVFTSVDFDSLKLVDGGVVRNFPVQEVRDMGANFVIGSSVANGLLPTKQINNVLQILLQIAFFQEHQDNLRQQALCNVYIFHPMDGYSAGSFSHTDEIIDLGIKEGREIYPRLKKIKDSLDAKYGPLPDSGSATGEPGVPVTRLPLVDSVVVSQCHVRGLKKTDSVFVSDLLQFKPGQKYTTHQLTLMARRLYGTRYFSRVYYYLDPLPDSTASLVFEVGENPATEAKVAVQYNSFSGANLIADITTRNYFTKDSRSLITASIGETFRIKGQHLQYFGVHHQTALILTAQFESPEYNSYQNFRKDGIYRNLYTLGDLRIQRSVNRIVAMGLGTRFEDIENRPILASPTETSGDDDFFTSYPYFQLNTLDRSTFPRTGWKINAEYDLTYGQQPDFDVIENGVPVNADSLEGASDYTRALLDAAHYAPLSDKSTLFGELQGGINFRYQVNRLNDFLVGGLTPQFHDQITFAGLDEGTINTSSVGSVMVGYRYEPFSRVFLTARENAGVYNFLNIKDQFVHPKYLSGEALSLGYETPFGPIEFSAMYSEQDKVLLGYVNIGFNF